MTRARQVETSDTEDQPQADRSSATRTLGEGKRLRLNGTPVPMRQHGGTLQSA
jgi:hypothetical protein